MTALYKDFFLPVYYWDLVCTISIVFKARFTKKQLDTLHHGEGLGEETKVVQKGMRRVSG